MEDLRTTLLARRTFLRGAALGGVGLAAAAVIGCGDDDDDDGAGPAATTAPLTATATPTASTGAATATPTAAAAETVKTGSITVAVQSSVGETLDPNSTAAIASDYAGIFDQLLRRDPRTNQYVPEGLATSWEFDTNNQTRWVFNLREADWNDGTPFTAEDVKFTLEYITNPDNKSRLISRLNTVDSVEVLDPRTAVVVTKAPDPILDRRMISSWVLPKHIYEDPDRGAEWQALSGKPVGTGSYVVDRWIQAERTDLVASASSWRGNKGIIEATGANITEGSTRASAFEAGDVAAINAPLLEVARLQGLHNGGVSAAVNVSNAHTNFSVEYHEGPTSDLRVRLALAHALDNVTYAGLYEGFAEEMQGQQLTRTDFGFNPNVGPYGYDPDMSRTLLRDAGFGNGFDAPIGQLTGNDPVVDAHTLAVKDAFDEIGLQASIVNIDVSTWRDHIYGRTPRIMIERWAFSGIGQHDAAFALSWSEGSQPSKFYANADFDRAFNEAIQTMDTDAREKKFWEAVQVMHDDPPAVWSTTRPSVVVWRSDQYDLSLWERPAVFFDQIAVV
ncbi:MAG: ABC transporter substrate-binding protein [Chloroflexi bacterium]|nr:ABC transporter substrate-binding protein [Chloroflexota bacterium]